MSSAEDLGTRELGQVRTQRLDELLTTLRLLQSPRANSKLGIPELDALLATQTPRFDPTNLSSIPAPPIIEITSPVPKSGKTELLYYIITKLVLEEGAGVEGGGKGQKRDECEERMDEFSIYQVGDTQQVPVMSGDIHETADHGIESTSETRTTLQKTQTHRSPKQPTAVALLTTTSTLSISRLAQTGLHNLLTLHPSLSLSKAQSIIHTALTHIHIFNTTSLPQLISTISSLPDYFLSSENVSTERKLGAITIDSASGFFWEDKVASSSGSTSKYPALATVLKKVSVTLQAPVIFTTEFISPCSTSGIPNLQSLRPQLPSPWPTIPSLHLIISKAPHQKYNQGINLEKLIKHTKITEKATIPTLAAKQTADAGNIEIKGNTEARAARKRERFQVCVNQWGDEGWIDKDVRSKGFDVFIGDEGVDVISSVL